MTQGLQRVRLKTTAPGFEDWTLQLRMPSHTQVKDLKSILAYGLPVTAATKVYPGVSGVMYRSPLADNDQIWDNMVLMDVLPLTSSYPPPFFPQLTKEMALSPESESHPMIKVNIKSTHENHEKWSLEVEVRANTTVSKLKELLTQAPHNLKVSDSQRVLMSGDGWIFRPASDSSIVTTAVRLQNFVPKPNDGNVPEALSKKKSPVESAQFLSKEAIPEVWGKSQRRMEDHKRLPLKTRTQLSYAYSLAWPIMLSQSASRARKGTNARPFTFWVLGCTNEAEVALAERGIFDEANGFDMAPTDVVLWGHNLRELSTAKRIPADNEPPRVRTANYDMLESEGIESFGKADMFAMFTPEISGRDGTAPAWDAIPERMRKEIGTANSIIVTRRFLGSENHGINSKALWDGLNMEGKNGVPPDGIMRNPFSAMAGADDIEYDENGWINVIIGVKALESVLQAMVPPLWGMEKPDDKLNAIFWGIIDLKYDTANPVWERVRILETGDGRSSRFSHDGAPLLERFQKNYKLADASLAGKHAVISANKKLTHDLIQHYGYGHVLPKQACFPKVYDEGLAGRIAHAIGVSHEDDKVVLKLHNRSRGAGVIPVHLKDLDNMLRRCLNPPKDLEVWFEEEINNGPESHWNMKYGCLEEHVRHWWSCECPHFIVEKFEMSLFSQMNGENYDGTMRVAFVLRKKDIPKDQRKATAPPAKFDPLFEDMVPPPEELLIDWLGGYWKLPKLPVDSENLRERCVSAARSSGTAVVNHTQLFEVYAALGNIVQLMFGGNEPSAKMLAATYSWAPELASYLTARLAISMKDMSRARMAMKLANQSLTEATPGLAKDIAESFVQRGFGTVQAMTPPGLWESAKPFFEKSIERFPANASSLYLLGMTELELGDTEKSVDLFLKSICLDPDFKAPYVNLGVAFIRLERFDEAIDVSEALLVRHPQSPQCNYHIGVACYQKAYLIEQRGAKEKALSAAMQEADALRKRATAELTAARESEDAHRLQFRGIRGGPGGMDPPWLDNDAVMLAAKTQVGKLPKVEIASDSGWRFFGYRN